MKRRGSGILLHITSLPSPYGIGDMGPWAYKFADFLSQAKQHYWQILPLNPADPIYGNSPYHSISAFANNLLLISPELMVQDGFLSRKDLEPLPNFPQRKVDYHKVIAYKENLFHIAYERSKNSKKKECLKFDKENAHWLEDFILFVACREHFQRRVWSDWPQEIRDRQPKALQTLSKKLHERIEMEKFLQYVFLKQWFSLKEYCNKKDIQIFGDIPIYVDHDSVDVWTDPGMFKLDDAKRPSFVAGVPPDYFSETGQLWGNPVYKWDALKKRKYEWWIKRIKHNLNLFDMIRIDHFRGLIACWEIAASEKNAIKGKWVDVPAEDFFNVLIKQFPDSPIIAEDLGIITPDVRAIMDRYGFPGMKVLLSAFGDDLATNPYVPHNHVKNCVLYTGTHDNNTIRGWFENEITQEVKNKFFQYLGRKVSAHDVHWELIRLAMMSVANMVIFPMQDVLGLGEEDRMNLPSTAKGNWEWKLLPEQITHSLEQSLLEMTETYGRA
ncbi:MAG: 4-alpha-glucanotransferase [Deltaproteobacteria bacterium]|nr:4-alpha-glucanotransferase [Deltaproteobacteria bacterium]